MENLGSRNENWKEARFLHIPTNKEYKYTGAGGVIRVDNSTNASLPSWLTENSLDWKRIK